MVNSSLSLWGNKRRAFNAESAHSAFPMVSNGQRRLVLLLLFLLLCGTVEVHCLRSPPRRSRVQTACTAHRILKLALYTLLAAVLFGGRQVPPQAALGLGGRRERGFLPPVCLLCLVKVFLPKFPSHSNPSHPPPPLLSPPPLPSSSLSLPGCEA